MDVKMERTKGDQHKWVRMEIGREGRDNKRKRMHAEQGKKVETKRKYENEEKKNRTTYIKT